MKKRLIQSVFSLVAILALGTGATYALFTSNTVTVSNNTLTTGNATVKICNALGANNWRNSVNPSFVANKLVPGGPEKELSSTGELYLGNDNGGLVPVAPGKCTSYFDAAGMSDVPMKFVPQMTAVTCDDASLKDQMMVRFEIGGVDSGYGSLTFWETNTTTYGATVNPDFAGSLKIYTKLDSAATLQNKTCTFNATFTGKQV